MCKIWEKRGGAGTFFCTVNRKGRLYGSGRGRMSSDRPSGRGGSRVPARTAEERPSKRASRGSPAGLGVAVRYTTRSSS